MPRLAHRVEVERLAYDTRMVLTLLMQEINVLRQQAGLAPRTPQQIRQAVRDYQRTNPPPGRP